MKKLLFLLPLLAIISCDKTDTENSGNAQFNSRGCLECDNYTAGESFLLDGIRYQVANKAMLTRAIERDIDLTKYCTSKIVDMLFLFEEASYDFNQNISSWDVSNVTNMSFMFYAAQSFNQDIGNWDVSNVTDMSIMFDYAESFNQDIGNWDVGNVTFMNSMFWYASSFNQDIGNWDVSNVTEMGGMFFAAGSFNQDLTQWCVSQFTTMPYNFSLSASTANHPVWGTCP
jgi:surface protein|tara:strand:- start:16 stop:702 length:687 start_codon:yes stop_codon:yes gene_type:complete